MSGQKNNDAAGGTENFSRRLPILLAATFYGASVAILIFWTEKTSGATLSGFEIVLPFLIMLPWAIGHAARRSAPGRVAGDLAVGILGVYVGSYAVQGGNAQMLLAVAALMGSANFLLLMLLYRVLFGALPDRRI
jgi:hypothetical protein